LSDYKVRILNPRNGAGHSAGHGTDAVTRVLLDSTEHSADRSAEPAEGGAGSWTTVGVHSNVVEASWLALVDALTTPRCGSGPRSRRSAEHAGGRRLSTLAPPVEHAGAAG